MIEVEKYLKSLNIKEKIVCATSGGVDSMVLLFLLNKIYPNKIVCAHVNHKKREASEIEKLFVKEYCEKNNISFEYFEITEKNNSNFHSFARKKRYNFFNEVCKKHNSKHLFTAHHNDDLIETILMRLSRGTSLIGYAGFVKETSINNINIIRPFITISKKEIEDFAKTNNIKYMFDSSNLSDNYTRNRYRKYIIPKLKEENKDLKEKYLKFNRTIIKYDSFVNKYIENIYDKIVINNNINLLLLKQEEEIIKEEIIKKYLSNIYKENLEMISDKNIYEIMKMIDNKKPNYSLNLPNDIVINKKYDIIYSAPKRDFKKDFKIELTNDVETDLGVIKLNTNTKKKNNYIIRLNTEELCLPLYLRNRKDGDIIEVKGIGKFKKVKDIFINEKVDVEKREKIPLVVDNKNTIIFIPGIKKSIFDKEISEDYNLVIEFIEEENK